MISKILPRWLIFSIGAFFGSVVALLIQSPILFLFGFDGVEAGRFSAGAILAVFYPSGALYVKFYEKHGLGFHWLYLKTFGGDSKRLVDMSWIFILTASFLGFAYEESYSFSRISSKGWIVIFGTLIAILLVTPLLTRLLSVNSRLSLAEGRLMLLVTSSAVALVILSYMLSRSYSPYSLSLKISLVTLIWFGFLCFKWVKVSIQK